MSGQIRSPRTVHGFVAAVIGLALATPRLAAQSPHLTGTIEADVQTGIISGKLCTSAFTPRRTARFLLSNALNIKEVSDGTRPLAYDGEFGGRIIGEAREYVIRVRDSLPPLRQFCVDFRGAVPPFDSASTSMDWKGRIALMKGNLRAAEQSRWYPTLYDSATGAAEDRLTYSLDVRCSTCRSIYVNGEPPVAVSAMRATATSPRPILLYLGNFAFTNSQSVGFINGTIGPETVDLLSGMVKGIGDYYSASLDAPYGDHPMLLSFESLWQQYPHGEVRWQFVTWPTITFSGGLTFDALLDRSSGKAVVPNWLWGSLSHEMGHYYFGGLREPYGPLSSIVVESLAEYLAMKSTSALRGEVALATRIMQYADPVVSQSFSPLDRATPADHANPSYRYHVNPLRLLVLEDWVGAPAMNVFLRYMLEHKNESADYAQVMRAVRAAHIEEQTAARAFALDGATLRSFVFRRSLAAIANQTGTTIDPATMYVAIDLINGDTAHADREAMLRALTTIPQRDSTQYWAKYQIGKLSAISGIDLPAGRAALSEYLRFPVKPGLPTHADAQYRLGMILEREGDKSAASDAYRRALEVNPAHAAAKAALEKLVPPR